MMICKADFEELFPHIFAPDSRPSVAPGSGVKPGVASIARWEDDGGRTLAPQPRQLVQAAKPRQIGYKARNPERIGATLAMLPVSAAVGTAFSMMEAWGRRAGPSQRLAPLRSN